MKISFTRLPFSFLAFFTLLVFTTVTSSLGQKNKKAVIADASVDAPVVTATAATSTASDEGSIYMQAYRNAKKYADYNTAVSMLYLEMTNDPENSALKDSMISLYFAMGYNVQCIALGRELLEATATDQKILEIVAISFQNLNFTKDALGYYEKLFALSKSPLHLYQIAVLQYSLGRTTELKLSVNQIVQNPESEKSKINITINRQGSQDVILKAAALNLLGVMYRDLKEEAAARESFAASSKVDDKFVLPKFNLAEMDKKAKEGSDK